MNISKTADFVLKNENFFQFYSCGIKIYMGGGDYCKKCFIFISLVCIVIFGIIYIETPVNPFHGVKATCKAENNSLAGYIQLLSGTSINSSKNKNVIIVVILVLF